MKRTIRTFLALSAAVVLTGCPDDDTGIVYTDVSADTGTGDTGVDADTTTDPCEGLTLCDAAGVTCDGDTLVDCAADANGCLVAVETDCAADDQVCDADAAACVDAGVCTDDCDDEGTVCDGDSIAECVVGSDGCLDLEVTECGGGETCTDGDEGPTCEATGACDGLEVCDAEGTFCEGTDIVTCASNDDGCIVRDAVACDEGVCVEDGDTASCEVACEDDAACTEEGQSCDGTNLNTCSIGESGCLELTTDDCATLADGGTCNADTGFCEAPGDPCADVVEACAPEDAGVSGCEEDIFVACTLDAFGCGVVEMDDCAAVDGGFCGDVGCEVVEPGVCDDIDAAIVCDEEGALSCGELGPIECQRNVDGCLTLVDLDACGDEEVCTDGFCAGPCADVEVCADAFSCDGDDAVNCEEVDGCLVETSRETCLGGCVELGAAAECAPFDACEAFACDVDVDVPLCDGDLIYNCVTNDVLGCDVYEESDCSDFEGETCVDDGFFATCGVDPCGDGLLDGFVGEECDDGNTDNDDGCSDECVLEDGFECEIVEDASVCVPTICGDGVVNGDEECDDENVVTLDGCDLCAVEDGYECTGEPSVCLIPACGDGVRNGDESCDDGNLVDGDGCTSECFIELSETAGDSVSIEAALTEADAQYDRIDEDCAEPFEPGADHFYDVYTFVNTTAAAIEILIDATWSADGYIHAFSSDFDPTDPGVACLAGDDDFGGTSGSRIESFIAEADTSYFLVASTFGAGVLIDEYTLTLTTAGCGDGALAVLEECDDSNTTDDDGCSATCTVEDGWVCEGLPSECRPTVCNDGVIEGAEECDDGNDVGDDGCSECLIDAGFVCLGAPSVCESATCGNGTLETGETCDDGNGTPGDGCSSACAIELLSGATEIVSGSIDDTDPVFDRPSAGCFGGGAADHFYDVYGFENVDMLPLEVLITATWDDGDGYLHGYTSFDPADSEAECVDGDDDFAEGGGPALGGSQFTMVVAPASSFEVVASTFSAADAIGTYTIELDSVVAAP